MAKRVWFKLSLVQVESSYIYYEASKLRPMSLVQFTPCKVVKKLLNRKRFFFKDMNFGPLLPPSSHPSSIGLDKIYILFCKTKKESVWPVKLKKNPMQGAEENIKMLHI